MVRVLALASRVEGGFEAHVSSGRDGDAARRLAVAFGFGQCVVVCLGLVSGPSGLPWGLFLQIPRPASQRNCFCSPAEILNL